MTRRTWSSVTVSSPSSAASALAACVLNDRMHKMEVFPPPELMKMRLVHYQEHRMETQTTSIQPTVVRHRPTQSRCHKDGCLVC